MKSRKSLLWLVLIGLLFSVQSAWAQEQGYCYSFQVVKASQSPPKKLLSSNEWKTFLKQSGSRILEDLSGICGPDQEALTMGGQKNPLGYNDTRAAGNQVQYVDLGAKIDAKLKPQANGSVFVEARGERSVVNPHPQAKDRASATIFEAGTVMKRGQVAVFVCARGPLINKLFKSQFQADTVKDSDWIVLALSIE